MELEKRKRIEEKIQKKKKKKSENVVFLGDSITEGYDLEAADANRDSQVNSEDIVTIINFMAGK